MPQSYATGVRPPANLARYFSSQATAKKQPFATIALELDANGFLFNGAHNPSLIRYDKNYLTTNFNLDNSPRIPTTDYILDLLNDNVASSKPVIVEIGAGQGEFVGWLQHAGFEAYGYDPALRTDGPGLFREFWNPTLANPAHSIDLIVMRCVLPHMNQPFEYLEKAFSHNPEVLVLVEFQDFSWTLENSAWWQITHDHVNYFSIGDFSPRFKILQAGNFQAGEWAWVLIGAPDQISEPFSKRSRDDLKSAVVSLDKARRDYLAWVSESKRKALILGGAGKGATIAFNLEINGVEVSIADLDPGKHGLFTECSGLRVMSYPEIRNIDVGTHHIALPNKSYLDEILEITNLQRSEIFIFGLD